MLDVVHQAARLVAFARQLLRMGQQRLLLRAQVRVLRVQPVRLLAQPVQLDPGGVGVRLAGLALAPFGLHALLGLGHPAFGHPGQRQVVGRHRPAELDLERAAAGLLQRVGRQRQLDPRVVAVQQQGEGRARPGRRLRHDAGHGRAEQRAGLGRRPLPAHIALRVAQREAVQVQKAGTVGRVELQAVRRGGRQGKAQRLARLADDAGGGQLARFVEAAVLPQVELAGEQRLGRQQRRGGAGQVVVGRQRLAGGLRPGDDDELVGQRVGQRQQMARHRRRQGVEGDLEFGIGQLAHDGLGLLGPPAVRAQKAHQRAAGEKAQVGFVQQAFGPVAEFAGHQLGHQTAVAGVRDRHQQPPARRQQRAAFGQHARRLADVLQHVGADDGVVGAGGEVVGQPRLIEIGHFDAPVVRGGQRGLVGADGQAVDRPGGGAVARRQKAADGAAAAAQVEHAVARPDMADQHRQ